MHVNYMAKVMQIYQNYSHLHNSLANPQAISWYMHFLNGIVVKFTIVPILLHTSLATAKLNVVLDFQVVLSMGKLKHSHNACLDHLCMANIGVYRCFTITMVSNFHLCFVVTHLC